MSNGGFLYFIESENNGAGSADFPELVDLVPDLCVATGRVLGPEGVTGLVAYPGDWPGERGRYIQDETRQRWEFWGVLRDGSFSGKRAWCGRWLDVSTTPEDLRRGELLEGWLIRMEDGRDWLFPQLMKETGESGLPQVVGLDGKGRLKKWPKPKYADVSRRGRALWETFAVIYGIQDRLAKMIDEAEMLEICIAALALNYRVGPVEVMMLGLFDERLVLEVSRHIVGANQFERIRGGLEQGKAEAPTPGS